MALPILTTIGRSELARVFYRTIHNTLTASEADQSEYYYYTIGKTTPWNQPWQSELDGEGPRDSQLYLNEFRRNIMFAQNLSAADVCFMISRRDWEPGIVYDQYDDAYGSVNINDPSYNTEFNDYQVVAPPVYSATSGATSLASATFYAMTDEYNVYKCLDNNNGEPSTVKPTSQATTIENTNDGYKWKFMFQVQAADVTKFLDAQYIPVRKVTGLPQFDVNGQIDSLLITQGGTNYTGIPDIVINGDGIDALATALIEGGVLTDIVIDNIGSGYSFAVVEIVGGKGIKAVLTPVIVGEQITDLTITNAGTSYISDPIITISGGGGLGATATATVSGGAITSISITSAGSGYTSTPTVTVTGGKGVDAVVQVTLGVVDGAPEEQTQVESTAIAGTMGRIIVQNAGAEYVAGDVSVVITGDGIGATAIPNVNAQGQITSITVTAAGQDYTYANISFGGSIDGGAVARAILSPLGGHGSDPIKELNCTTVGIAATLSDKTNSDLILGNDFRQIGLVKNFLTYNKSGIYTGSTATTSTVIKVDDSENFEIDDIINFVNTTPGSTATGSYRVSQVLPGITEDEVHLQTIVPGITNANKTYIVLTNYTKSIPLTGLVINSVTEPEINIATGHVISVENRAPINRSEDQAETIKLLVNF